MALINWNDRLSVNVKVIDEQHKKLVDMINDLHDAMKQRKGKEILNQILTSLIEYTAIHFKQEEGYLTKFGYKDIINHKKKHVEFVQKVVNFKKDFENGKILLTIEVMDFLSEWLKEHIQGTDKEYTSFLNEKGMN